MKYAVFTVCVPEYDVPDVPVNLKRFGYDGVEWRVTKRTQEPKGTNFWNDNKATVEFETILDQADAIREMTANAGLEIPSVGFYVSCSDRKLVEKALKAARELGAKCARISVPRYDGSQNYNELFRKTVEEYREVAHIAAESNVKALAELHMGNIIPSASAAYRLVSNFDPESVGVILDPGNMTYEGYENWQLGCELLGPYLGHVHAKNACPELVDVTADGRASYQFRMAPIRSGLVDWLSVMKALRTVGYDGWISVEDFSTAKPVDERMQDDIEFLKLMEAKAGKC